MKEVDYVKTRPYLTDNEHLMGEIVEIIKEKKLDYVQQKPCLIGYECIVIEEKKAECCGVEDQNALEYEEIELKIELIEK